MIGFWHHDVLCPSARPPGCLSVCNAAVHRAPDGRCWWLKVVPYVVFHFGCIGLRCVV